MAFIDLFMLPICIVRRKARLDVNTLERARKPLKSRWGAVETGDGAGTPGRMVKKALHVVCGLSGSSG
jgi:hypothetical protein